MKFSFKILFLSIILAGSFLIWVWVFLIGNAVPKGGPLAVGLFLLVAFLLDLCFYWFFDDRSKGDR